MSSTPQDIHGGNREELTTMAQDGNTTAAPTLTNEKLQKDPFLVKFEYEDGDSDPRRWKSSKKWAVVLLTLTFSTWAQMVSSMYAPAAEATARDLGVGVVAARVGQAIFLYGMAVGPILMAPLSEDFGRKPVLIAAVLLLGIFQIPTALTTNLGVFIFFRFLAGAAAAAAFNVVGVIADLWPPEEQGWAVNTFALTVELGAVAGPIAGAYIYLNHGWRWIFGVSGIVLGGIAVVFLILPETRADVLLTRKAVRKRKETGDDRFYAMHERARKERTIRGLLREVLIRPIFMLFTEPIVWMFAAYDGVNYAVLYLALESFPLIYGGFGFSLGPQNFAFIPFAVGFIIAYLLYPIQIYFERRAARRSPDGEMPPEARLLWCLGASPLFAVSLFIFAWTCKPEYAPWIASMIASAVYGAASHVIFIAVSDYTIAAYSLFAASAVGGQSFAREFLSGSVTLFSAQMYEHLGYQWASTLLALLATLLALVPYVLYSYGPKIRQRSSYHEEIVAFEREMRKEMQAHETQRLQEKDGEEKDAKVAAAAAMA
ncbi:unnamed protein product [Tilletia caries]|uniref:Major facilitator superfamily (MFS) profile domain-containing protein n=2 Tax=Tilletia TaxID=13289 RepID=A0A177VA81_9BASI|nr:hypothetical protein CF336_g7727 [Tilletia laevis]KAE8186913.1 hypothetical protein CF335_g7313 [Tilletia laevis]KAE8265749.1 hypothetical protein A4X03_0g57 [Tilletia caries]CAD6896307.1 unnamed protein product [Tilletia caries]CAD6927959.1 unnamed protein product [Tilletia caries]